MNFWLITGVVGSILFFMNQKVSANPASPASGTKPTLTPIKEPQGFPLKLGSKGSVVKTLQQALYVLGNDSVKNLLKKTSYNTKDGFDGIFGQGTQQALAIVTKSTTIDYQSFLNLIKKANA